MVKTITNVISAYSRWDEHVHFSDDEWVEDEFPVVDTDYSKRFWDARHFDGSHWTALKLPSLFTQERKTSGSFRGIMIEEITVHVLAWFLPRSQWIGIETCEIQDVVPPDDDYEGVFRFTRAFHLRAPFRLTEQHAQFILRVYPIEFVGLTPDIILKTAPPALDQMER